MQPRDKLCANGTSEPRRLLTPSYLIRLQVQYHYMELVPNSAIGETQRLCGKALRSMAKFVLQQHNQDHILN
eukprot:82174-Amphidinium_carterae.1